jgi:hypothetical protein
MRPNIGRVHFSLAFGSIRAWCSRRYMTRIHRTWQMLARLTAPSRTGRKASRSSSKFHHYPALLMAGILFTATFRS